MLHVVNVPALARILQLLVVGILVLFASFTVMFPENVNVLCFLSVYLIQECDCFIPNHFSGNTQCTISSLKGSPWMQKPVFSSKIPASLILVLPEEKENKKIWTGM